MNILKGKAAGADTAPTSFVHYFAGRAAASANAIAASMQRRHADAAEGTCDGHYEVLER